MKIRLQHLRPTRSIVALDCETTGLDPTSRVVEIAALKVNRRGQCEWFKRLVNPGEPIPHEATLIHGITDQDVAKMPRFGVIANELFQYLNGADLLAYSASFDLLVLAAEFARVGMRFRIKNRSVLDPLEIFRKHEPRTLANASMFYLGEMPKRSHTAATDALNALKVLDAQIGRYGLPPNPEELHKHLGQVDVGGCFTRDAEGRLVLTFGTFRDRLLSDVAAENPDYLHSLLKNHVLLDDARELINEALFGRS